jgi:hypothetical protein
VNDVVEYSLSHVKKLAAVRVVVLKVRRLASHPVVVVCPCSRPCP